MRSTVTFAGETSMRAGLRRISAASLAMSGGMVAENSSVCRSLPQAATIFRTSPAAGYPGRGGWRGGGRGGAGGGRGAAARLWGGRGGGDVVNKEYRIK